MRASWHSSATAGILSLPTTNAPRGGINHTLGPDFRAIYNGSLTGGETWSGQARWEDRPAEHWAEAVVEVSLGERVRFGRSMPLDPAVVEAVRAWAAGD